MINHRESFPRILKNGFAPAEESGFAFLGEKRIERFVLARDGEKAGTFVSLTKDFPLWMIKADKEELCILQAPAGASAAVLLLERLYAYGVERW